jgi:restriction system protein
MVDAPFLSPPALPQFVGRERELAWLDRETNDRGRMYSFAPIVVVGPGGIGKTSLVREFVGRRGRSLGLTTRWFSAYDFDQNVMAKALRDFTETLHADRLSRELWIVLDGVDEGRLTHDQLTEAVRGVFNFKAVRALIMTSRADPRLPRQRVLNLDVLRTAEARSLMESLLLRSQQQQQQQQQQLQLQQQVALSSESIARVLEIAKGHPLVISLIGDLAKSHSDEQLLRILEGHLYDLEDSPSPTTAEIVTIVKPTIISANEAMVEALKKRPEDIFKLSSRKYEELVAELLSDMGYDVELTPATRDGGKDILAYVKTGCGTLLCLVEAKRYRSDRKIGVELVRTLYGTLVDYQANSAMMVTSSSFSKDAHDFQKKHEYQLALRDYADLTGWIQKYGKRDN